MRTPQAIPALPRFAAAALHPLPLTPLSLALTALVRRLGRTHPGLFDRLGPHGGSHFLIDPTDLPFALLLDLPKGRPAVRAVRRPVSAETRIAGRLAALIGLVHGAYDGDALFFSRDLVIEGDTAAALALRNAIDDAELDFASEAAALAGPLAAPLAAAVGLAERMTGLPLRRMDEA